MTDMERPAVQYDGPLLQPGHRLDTDNSNGLKRCRVEYCKTSHLIVSLGGWWCAEHAAQYIAELRRRVARRAVGLPQDSVIGLGIFLRPASEEWPPSFVWLRCDMCPREWVGPRFEICPQCKLDVDEALELNAKQHARRNRETTHVA